MEFELIYDIVKKPWTLSKLDLIVFAWSVFAVLGPLRGAMQPGAVLTRRLLFLFLSMFFGLTAYLIVWGKPPHHYVLIEAYETGSYEIVEGVVEDFVPMPWSGHSLESFEVNGVTFEYSDFRIVGAYNQTQAYGGMIREGQYVEIWHVDGDIIRLSIARTIE